VDCPANCASVEYDTSTVYGTEKYGMSSSICRAAIHDGRIDNAHGGTTYAQRISAPSESLGTGAHGIVSENFDSSDGTAFIFQGRVLKSSSKPQQK